MRLPPGTRSIGGMTIAAGAIVLHGFALLPLQWANLVAAIGAIISAIGFRFAKPSPRVAGPVAFPVMTTGRVLVASSAIVNGVVLLPKPPPEPPRIRNLEGLAPKFRVAVEEKILGGMWQRGKEAIVFESTRSDARCHWLFGFGREYTDGRANGGVVTMAADGTKSWHSSRYGLAVDIVEKTLLYKAPESFWTALGECCHEAGLEWGGDWPKFPDRPHVQWKMGRKSPSEQDIQHVADVGSHAFWEAIGVT